VIGFLSTQSAEVDYKDVTIPFLQEVHAGPFEAGDKTHCDRVTAGQKDDRYGRGRCLRRQRCGGAGGYDHGYAAADEIGCERRQHSAETSHVYGI
jgi:hypothetical protein